MLRARQYDPNAGRFTTADPIAGAYDALPGNSLYAYANNNPLLYTDPAGLWGLSDAWDATASAVTDAGEWAWEHKSEIAITAAVVVGSTACVLATAGICAGPIATGLVLAAVGSAGGMATYAVTQECLTSGGFAKAAALGAATNLIGAGVGAAVARAARAMAPVFKSAGARVAGQYRAAMATSNAVGRDAGFIATPGAEAPEIPLKYMSKWTPEQRAAARAKAEALTNADTTVTAPNRSNVTARKRFMDAGGVVPVRHDVDHVIDLQLGGADDVSNMSPLDFSVNRSLGSQINNQIKRLGLQPGDRVGRFYFPEGG